MSDEFVRAKRSSRRKNVWKNIKKQVDIARSYDQEEKNPHKFAKRHSMNCGNPNCLMCGNPRKVWNQKSLKEIINLDEFDSFFDEIIEDEKNEY